MTTPTPSGTWLGHFEEWVISLVAVAEGKGRAHVPLYQVREELINAVRVVVERSMDEE